MADDHTPDEIICDEDVFDIAFHPLTDIVALGTVSGVVEVYKYSEETNSKVLDLRHHQDACRAVLFAPDGQSLYTASSDRSIRAVDTLGNIQWAELRAHNYPVNRLQILGPNIVVSGDDEGGIKIWDTRQHNCIVDWKYHTDFISDFATNTSGDHLLATSGDGRLSVYDLRKNVLAGQSDELDDELLSITVLKHDKKVVCGSQDGVLVVFSWGTWGDMSDRFPGHPDSVETIVKVDEDTILTGSCDGIVRVVQLHPNKLLGLIGEHEDFPIEALELSYDKRILGSISHTKKVHFWDVAYLFDEDDDEEDEDVADGKMGNDDSDEDMEDIDDRADPRVKPSEREQFFSDL